MENDQQKSILTIRAKLSADDFYRLKDYFESEKFEGLTFLDAGIEMDSRLSIEDVNLAISKISEEDEIFTESAEKSLESTENLLKKLKRIWDGLFQSAIVGSKTVTQTSISDIRLLYQNLFESGWTEMSVRSSSATRDEKTEDCIELFKEIELGANQSVRLEAEITPESDEEVWVLIMVLPGRNMQCLPLGLIVEAIDNSGNLITEIDESGNPIPMIKTIKEDNLNKNFKLELGRPLGEHFRIRLMLQNASFTEEI